MPLLLFLLGLLPFAVGGLMNWAMLAYPDVLPPFSLIAILFLLIWGAIAFFARPCVAGVRTLAVCLNLAAGIDLILGGVPELVLGAYWSNPAGLWAQLYYLPLMNLGFTLTPWSHSVFPAYCTAFLLMLAATFLGARWRKS